MRTSIRFFAVLALVLSLFAVGASAQTNTTGSIEGTVTDVNGAAVPGVTVTVSGPNLIRPQTATSNDEGIYRIPNIPPGTYTVTVEAAKGFAKFEQTQVEVNLTKTSNVTVQLRPQGATESVEVTASSGAAIDVTSNTQGTNVSTEQFSNFPTQRTVQSLYTIAPTAARSGLRDASGRDRDPSVGGSSGPENNYILDGVTVSDPAFGGSGANLPFEFVQEVQVQTGAYGADTGHTTGGVFNVITKSGTNNIRGDAFVYFTPSGFVRGVKSSAIPFTGSAPNGFSEVDAGFDIGGPIIKDKLTFFGAFNPQERKNFSLTQTFLNPVENKVTTPFYAGKITWNINQNHVFNFSTFGDFTKQTGFLFGNTGFGADPNSFTGEILTGGQNYAFRENSTFSPNFIGEFSVGLHFQRANTLPSASTADTELVTDAFAVQSGNTVLPDVNTNVVSSGLRLAFVNGTGGTLQRNYVRQGFGLVSNQQRNRYELAARLQNIWGKHTFKYGFEANTNRYKIDTRSTGPTRDFAAPISGVFNGFRVTNSFGVCQGDPTNHNIICPNTTFQGRANALIAAGSFGTQYTTSTVGGVSLATITNPILILSTVGVRDFRLSTHGDFARSNTQSFYIQDDFKATKNLQFNLGLRWDYQQTYNAATSYFKLNSFKDNMQPRLGFIYDFTGQGRGKIFANFARYVETPIPLDLNIRAGGNSQQTDFNIRVSQLNAPAGSTTLTDFGNLGGDQTPIDPGLKPQTVNEWTAGVDYEVIKDFSLGFRGIYRNQVNVIEDGSFDDGTTYFIFNPGRVVSLSNPVTTEDKACSNPLIGCFGHARRYYRALEFTATKRFTNNWQLISSYVFSSLIGNYEGLFRNDNGQSDPNITSLFDLVSLLKNTYGRLPNDRPHQFKLDGSYRTPFKLLVSSSFRIQSGIPFDQLIPHPVYGNNEGFAVPRGTAINPITGSNRTPTTWNIDFGAYYPIQLGENRQLRLQLDWFNITNNQKAIRQDTTFSINSGASGIPPVNNPFFGTGTIFQFPSALRLGVKFQF
ncbi:MAG TPA: TonB-dependent receptor [Pyrinomonadaceae bacterium]|nr:TonB-dependent receptor [Pyrinomonadaceae bacterium]